MGQQQLEAPSPRPLAAAAPLPAKAGFKFRVAARPRGAPVSEVTVVRASLSLACGTGLGLPRHGMPRRTRLRGTVPPRSPRPAASAGQPVRNLSGRMGPGPSAAGGPVQVRTRDCASKLLLMDTRHKGSPNVENVTHSMCAKSFLPCAAAVIIYIMHLYYFLVCYLI